MKTKSAPKATVDRLDVGNTYFVRTQEQLAESLFSPGGTASGLFKIRPGKGVLFMEPNGEPIAFLYAHRPFEQGVVTCSRGEDGRLFYMFGMCTHTARRMGLEEIEAKGHLASCQEALRIRKQAGI